MKRLIAYLPFFLMVASSSLALAQSNNNRQQSIVVFKDNVNAPLTFDERKKIEEVYGEHMYKEILNRPNRLKSIKNILRNRVEIMELNDPSSQKQCEPLSSVPVFNVFVKDLKRDSFFNKATFNPLKYAFPFYGRHPAMYRVDGTNTYIYIKSQFSKQ